MEGEASRNGGKNINSLDLMKFIAAILVVSIHTKPLLSFNEDISFGFISSIARIAVPFFFMTSGYLFYSKIRKQQGNNQYVAKYLYRLILVYLFWSIVYFVYHAYNIYAEDQDIVHSLLIFVQNFFVDGSHFHLWYFPALIFAIALFYLLSRMMPVQMILAISFVFYLIGLFGDSYGGLIEGNSALSGILDGYESIFVSTRNGLFFGLFYVSLGAFMAIKQAAIKPSISAVLCCVSLAGLVIEFYVLNTYTEPVDFNMMLFLIPSTYFLVHFLLNMKWPDWNLDYRLLRDSSVLIYCTHPLFMIVYPKAFSLLSMNLEKNYSWLYFMITLLSSFVLSFVIIRLRQNEKTSKLVSLTY